MQANVVAHHQGSYFFDDCKRAKRRGENSKRAWRIGDLDNLVVAQHQGAAFVAMVEDENRAAVFFAHLQLAVGDAKEGVALMEYRAARISYRARARLGLGM